MPDRVQAERREAGTLDALREAMVDSIGRRTVGNTDSPTPIASLSVFRREMPMPPTICLVAAGIVLQSGGRAWYWKTAYDPALARFSPGVQLALELTRLQLDARGVDLTDSCAIENHPMIDHLWPERRTFADIFVGIDASRTAGATVFARREAIRRTLRRKVKSLILKLAGRHAS